MKVKMRCLHFLKVLPGVFLFAIWVSNERPGLLLIEQTLLRLCQGTAY